MNHSQLFKQTIAAGANVPFAATGNKLFVRTASQPFKVKFDNGSTIEVEDGFSFFSDELFSRLEVTNPNAADLYVEFYVGDATIERNSPLFARDALTTVGPNSTNVSLNAGVTSATFPAATAGKHRKEVIIGNANPVVANEVQVLIEMTPGSFTPVAFVPGSSSFVIPSNVAFQIYATGTNSSACKVYILELLYA
jgi:hypothetical protein